MSNFFSGGRPLPRGRSRASSQRATLCRCGKESKEVWALVGRNCWLRLPLELRSQVTLRRAGKTTEEKRGAVRACFEWLNDHPEEAHDVRR